MKTATMIELYEFQAKASDSIAERVVQYLGDPLRIKRKGVETRIPFIQLLNSITASGKTVILADAVSSIAKQLPVAPVVLWLSKATVVVEQTYAALDAGGAYHSLLDDFQVWPLADYDAEEVKDTDSSLLLFATVGLINQRDKEHGDRRVFKSSIDDAAQSTWESLKSRRSMTGHRRPLIVVYDEAHNLSDQQTDILLDLDPDAFLLSTATQRLPRRFAEAVVGVLRTVGGHDDKDLVTAVDAKAVADTSLIKTRIDLVGRQAPMEHVVAEMVEAMRQTEEDAKAAGLYGLPKAVYVCKTNVIEGSDEKDKAKQPFTQRQAPPILIWRHLVEQLGIDASEVAVYANLKVDKDYPLPDELMLFSGGEKDYDSFVKGPYRHVVFNQSLQEGWDDPLVYFAYIDKSMGSKVQAEQVVGRLLRQPGRKHYPADRLNAAGIYVRVETTGVFDSVVQEVQDKITSENLDVRIAKSPPGKKARDEVQPKGTHTVPRVGIVADDAEEAIAAHIEKMTDYRDDSGANIIGQGKRVIVQKFVGDAGNESLVWEEHGESAMVLARWLFSREVRRVHHGALGLALTSDKNGQPTAFDARVGLGSRAAQHISDVAKKVGEAYIENVYLKLTKPNPYVVGPMLMQLDEIVTFKNAVHGGYDGLNSFEKEVANGLDRTGLIWARNPSRSGYRIPLTESGRTQDFFPDFLVWEEDQVFAVEVKGAYLHSDALRKLVNIQPGPTDLARVWVRFILEGLVDDSGATPSLTGYTILTLRPDGRRSYRHFESIDEALAKVLVPTK
jgi:type III restriction enzyme